MKKALIRTIVLSAMLILGATPTALAQSTTSDHKADSIAFVGAMWDTDSLDGFVYRHFHFQQRQLFNSNQYICIIEIPRGSQAHLAFVADTLLTPVSDFAGRNNALAAINGSYFNMSTGAPVCYLKIKGQKLGDNNPDRRDSTLRKYYQNAVIRLLPSGRPRFNMPDSSRRAEYQIPDSNVMTSGPMLLYRGQAVSQRNNLRFVYGRHNRTAIGLKPDGTIVLLVADGRHRNKSEGLSLTELTLVMRWLGCCEAANLDGGGSSCMYIKGLGEDGVVNHPSDNGRFDAQGQRRVANAIVVVK